MTPVTPTIIPASVHVQTQGQGPELVLLHGWGVNGGVFSAMQEALPEYRTHVVDLPGFGLSPPLAGGLDAWVDALVQALPANAIWLGWSLGGQVATQAALRYPSQIKGLVTIASSPCFIAKKEQGWPGIAPAVLSQFGAELGQDLPRTIERFLAIQAMGSVTAKADIKQLKDFVLSRPLASPMALTQGLAMLHDIDLRSQIGQIPLPWLRLWGRLDGLVPRGLLPLMPTGEHMSDVVLAKASHAPFISHQEECLQALRAWLTRYHH
ncbi:pimeloyl-ACP methyl ester esterase BioH [Shewanella sp.]|uniref:pimeloyl-ACP methyl ester esterase BioH n=1 Tax=Shewanella sp. TaxID=50422 RepID=UPI003F2A62ED